jgi:hypothetical protein
MTELKNKNKDTLLKVLELPDNLLGTIVLLLFPILQSLYDKYGRKNSR